MAVDADFIEERFYYHVARIWGEHILEAIEFNFALANEHKAPMSLSYIGRPKAIGNSIISAPRVMTLNVNENFFSNYSEAEADKIIIHEVIHVGYSKHDKYFRDLVIRYGGVVTISHLEGNDIAVQIKLRANKHGRYKTIKTYPIEKLIVAQRFGKNYSKEHLDMRVRLYY